MHLFFVTIDNFCFKFNTGMKTKVLNTAPFYSRDQIRSVIRQLQYDLKIHLVDEVPVEFTETVVPTPDPKYGAPPVSSNRNNHLNPPSPTYGVPGYEPGSPSTRVGSFPNNFQQPPRAVLSSPAPTYGVPKSAYIPPPASTINNFQVNPSIQNPNYFTGNRLPTGSSSEGSGYVYNKPNANLKSSQVSAQLQVKRKQEGEADEDSSKSDEEQSIKSIEFTTQTPRAAPEFFFSEQFEPTQAPPAVVTSSLPIQQQQPQRQQQQSQQQHHAFHPQEQPFFPNSPPAPFSTAVYQERSLKLQQPAADQLLEPLPTLATDTQPPSPQAKNFYRLDSLPAQSSTQYNQVEWFRRISRSLANESEIVEPQMPPRNETFLNELRKKKEMLEILFPVMKDEEEGEVEEDLIINFEAAHSLSGGNRTSRTKRQSSFGTRMCETTTQFIEPQAALTRDGEIWV